MFGRIRHKFVIGATSALFVTAVAAGTVAAVPNTATDFNMQVSAGAKTCLPHATAGVGIESQGPVEVMTVDATGLPPETNFDFFVIQVQNKPFGVAWYQGDLETNNHGQ